MRGILFINRPPPPHALQLSFQMQDHFAMYEDKSGRIVETPLEARQAELGPSVLTLLIVSVALAAVILGVIWVIFFRT